MNAIKCPSCGKQEMRLEVIARHVTRLAGIGVTVPDAEIAKCANCGETMVSVKELERWKDLQRKQLLGSQAIPGPEDVRTVRESLGFSVSDFAGLMAVTRQTVHAWERPDIGGMQLGPGALLIKLLQAQVRGELGGVCERLLAAAIERGQVMREAAVKHGCRTREGGPCETPGLPSCLRPRRPAGAPTLAPGTGQRRLSVYAGDARW
jgi:DNA-binding transcriptional regulator YiaG